VQLDRKLLLIAPTVVLCFVVAGMLFAALQLHLAASGSDSLKTRSDFVAAVERGEKTLNQRQSAGLLRLSLQVEERRSAALAASRDLIVVLAAITLAACVALAIGIRTVPREHWPRLSRNTKQQP
jgi:hypothetical protein